MKCIHCSTDNTYRDRQAHQQKCKSCLHPFAFEPKTDPLQMSDTLFARAIKDVSADDTLAFTPRQLWYEINRRLLARKTLSCGASVLLILIGGGLLYQLRHAGSALIGASGLMMAAAVPKKPKPTGPRYPKLPYETFDHSYLQKWVATHGTIIKMLPPPTHNGIHAGFGSPTAAGRQEASDVTAYSFDRALVVEHADIAAMLVANHFHFENNCAILSLDGYPFGSAETVKTMLARNPNLKVFALHDATLPGSQMPHVLRRPEWFPNTATRLIDLGLRPQHVIKGGLIALQHPPQKFPVGVSSTSLTAAEIAWLEQGNTAELHALRPHKLMRAVYQGFARASQTDDANVGPNGVIYMDTGPSIWIYNSGMDVYAADSFG